MCNDYINSYLIASEQSINIHLVNVFMKSFQLDIFKTCCSLNFGYTDVVISKHQWKLPGDSREKKIKNNWPFS